MKLSETPAFRLTADCIWNSFRISGKRHLILTGSRGSGKTTLLSQLVGTDIPGLTTRVVREEAVYLKDNISGKEVQIGQFDSFLPGFENRMRLCPEGFHHFGIPALRRFAAGDSEWVRIDEIGYLETGSPEYCAELYNLMEHKRLLAVVRKQELPFLKELLHWGDALVVDLDNPFGELGCVIMASGLGKRFGGNKLMAPFRGEPMISQVLAATEGIFAHRVVVTRHPDVAKYCRERRINVVMHDLPFRSDTVHLGLAAVGEVPGCMFCLADQPLLKQDTIKTLAICACSEPDAIWRMMSGEEPGAPILFPRWTFPGLRTLSGDNGGAYLLKKYPEHVRSLPVRDPYELRDVDTPADLSELEAYTI